MSNYTLITGASEGLGVEFARIAASEGRNLILTARQADKLDTLASELRTKNRDVVVIPADLSRHDEVERLWTEASSGREIDILINNAGLGYNGRFDSGQGWPREMTSMAVNMGAFTYLMKMAIPPMQSRGAGQILNVASVAGFLPGPNMAVYHASKAYTLSLSEAVDEELRGTGVSITALCPGATATNFFEDADMHGVRLLKFGGPMAADVVAQAGWDGMRACKRIVIPGWLNKIFAFSPRLSPRALTTRIAALVMAKA